MGTHPSGHSLLADNGYAGQPLLTLLRDRPQMLGAALPRFGCDLPFLFKVLSVGTALSIQSHPDKELAERLHAEKPEVGAGRVLGGGRKAAGGERARSQSRRPRAQAGRAPSIMPPVMPFLCNRAAIFHLVSVGVLLCKMSGEFAAAAQHRRVPAAPSRPPPPCSISFVADLQGRQPQAGNGAGPHRV